MRSALAAIRWRAAALPAVQCSTSTAAGWPVHTPAAASSWRTAASSCRPACQALATASCVAGQHVSGAHSAARRIDKAAWPWSKQACDVRMFSAASAAGQRNPDFSVLTDADLQHFRQILGSDAVVTGPEALRKYNRDWMQKYEGASQVALLPQTTQQVSQVLQHCSARRLAVVPQGGNSSLAGGAVPCFDEVVLSTAAMKRLISFEQVSGVVQCEAGCTLQEVDDYVHERGFMVPLDLGAKETCHIGGNVVSNAGGLRLLRYGSMRANVLGVEAVLPNGTIMDLMSTCRKDNTGYDLKQLFIGSEGTLGVVTAVALACPPVSAAVDTVCLACKDWETTIAAFHAARQHVGEALSAFEFFDEAALHIALDHVPGLQHPTPKQPGPFYVILEASSSDARSNAARLDAFLAAARAAGSGGVLGGSGSDEERQQAAAHIWSVRKNLSEGLRLTGDRVFKYDLSLAPGEMYALVEETRRRLADFPDSKVLVLVNLLCTRGLQLTVAKTVNIVCNTVGYGHLGDGNLHLNVVAPADGDAIQAVLEPFLYEYTAERGGSISAEHGLGQMKNQYMGFSKPKAAIDMMRQIKQLFDPSGVMNPYKLLPP